MKYYQFVEKLELDTSLYELERYIKGEKRLPDSLRKHHKDLDKLIPILYERQKKETNKFGRVLSSSALFKLAFHKLGQEQYRERFNTNKINRTFLKTLDIMLKIINRVDNSVGQGGKNLFAMLKEYCEKK